MFKDLLKILLNVFVSHCLDLVGLETPPAWWIKQID